MTWVADRESLDCRMPLRLQVPATDRAEDTTGNPSGFGIMGARRHAPPRDAPGEALDLSSHGRIRESHSRIRHSRPSFPETGKLSS